jgi:[ribosomal protein S18]-alanine N-acetyltransferase
MMGFLPRARIFVEELRSAEADALAEIHAEVFARAWEPDDFAALMARDNVFALSVRRDSLFGTRRRLGFVVVRTAADEAEILTIAVRPGNRGRGYGRLLMEEAMRRLYRDRVAACFLEVDQGNDAALGLYRKLGFKEVGRRKGYYQAPAGTEGTALVMRAQLR